MDFDEEGRKALQALFDKAHLGLRSQGFKRSTSPDGGRCRYRGADGRKCAVGWLLDDGAYTPLVEGSCAVALTVRGGWRDAARDGAESAADSALAAALEASGVPATPDVLRLLWALQEAHDYPERRDPTGVAEAMARVAQRFGLTVPAPAAD